jgi:molybdopterin-guanine dinucleotide biosynthesis protein A
MHPARSGAADSFAGFVLTGGSSKRMGHNKALLPFGDGVLVAHIAGCVRDAAGSVRLVGSPDAYTHLDFLVVPDLYPGFGPVGGIVTALNASEADWNLVVACDMPGISSEFLISLLEKAADSGADCTLPLTPDGGRHPLCAVYRRTAKAALTRAVEAGTHKLLAAIEALNVHRYLVSETGSLVNVNTPMEWNTFQNATR